MSHGVAVRRPVAALILAAASWGVGTVLSKQAIAEIPPFLLLPVQLAVSLTSLGAVAHRRGEHLPRGREGRLIGRLGLLNPGAAYALSLIGLTMISASMSVLIWALEPVLILALGVAVLRERPGWVVVLLSAVAIFGLGLVLYDPGASGGIIGVALTVAGIACCAVYTVATRHWLPDVPSTLGVVVAQQAYALAFAVGLLVIAAVGGAAVAPTGPTLVGLTSAAVSGLLYYAVAYWLYLTGLRRVPASIAAVSFYLIPVFGVGAASLTGERLSPHQWVGALVVIGAVAAVTIRTAALPPLDAA